MDLTLTPAWSIELAGDAPPARLAAAELRDHLAALGGPALPIVAAAQGPRVALRYGAGGDGFVRAPDATGLTLRGEGPRGLLFAAYELLEALGCRWPAPGLAHVPRRTELRLPSNALADRPAIARRSLIVGHDHYLAEAEGWIVWAARNRLNTIFVHTTIHEPALGACRLASWRKRRGALLPLIRERGLELELGGHHLRDMLPRRLFRFAPMLFRHDGVRRVPDHNLCVSNPRALDEVRRMASAFYRAYPEAQVYHLWPDDLRAGGWCHCSACAGLTPADQALIATNALAEALPARPGLQVAYLAYHDTEAPPVAVKPRAAVAPLFAPRLRSYAEGIDGAANAGVRARLLGCAAHFAAPAAVFEYYLDGILFKSAPPPLPTIIGADMADYAAAGMGTVHALLTGDRPFLHAPPNAYLFARFAWAPGDDPHAVLATYAAARAPAMAPRLALAYTALEAAWRPVLTRDPDAAEARLRGLDPVGAPPADVLDMIVAPRVSAELRLEAMSLAEDALARGEVAWEGVTALDAASAQSLARERAEWTHAALLLRFLRLRQQLYVLAGRAAPVERLAEALDAAQDALDALVAWSARFVPPEARAGHALLRAPFQLQLDHVADRTLRSPLARLGLRARRAGDLAKIVPGLIR